MSDTQRFLDGKAVVVTGSGGGLGRAYALDAAANGAAVVVNDVDYERALSVAKEIEQLGGRACADGHSVDGWDQAGEIIGCCLREFGRIDGLVNNAGVAYGSDAWTDTEADIRHLIDVNLLGTMFCGIHAFKHMVTQRSGSIVNVSSMGFSGVRKFASYAASKGGVLGATYAWALDGAPYDVRVNALFPSARTAMNDVFEESEFRPIEEWNPAGVAPMVTYLLSDRSGALTGQAVRYSRGELSLMARPHSVDPVLTQEAWTVSQIAEAMSGELAAAIASA
jgi:NAD(P)-dependent dehydrogenase (short-subunit alcohol dehydrogenase family)